MDEQELIAQFPALSAVLADDPDLSESVRLVLEHNLIGSLRSCLDSCRASALRTFLKQISIVDFDRLAVHRDMLADQAQDPLGVKDVEAVKLHTLEDQKHRHEQDLDAGRSALSSGQVASVAFAGGSGTRFFSHLDQLNEAIDQPNEMLLKKEFDPAEPKGVFPISPVGGLSFYDSIIASALAAGVETGRLPWVLLLTSRVTHQRTKTYLAQHHLWGLPQSAWLAFQQADEPRLNSAGDLVVCDEEGHLAWTGDGHGGVYRALLTKNPDGLAPMDLIRRSGVKLLVMHNVDNGAARPFAPKRIGFHLNENSLFTVSATRKLDPDEKVGVLMRVRSTAKVEVVEYNVIDPAIARQRDPDTGRLVHEAGNINTNLVSIDAIRSDIDPTLYTGKAIQTCQGLENTSSLEMLNQHLTRLLDPERVRAYEVDRQQFFMPTKNVTGVDSVASTIKMMSDRFGAMMRGAGAHIATDALCDLHPACGCDSQALLNLGLGPGWRVESRARLYLCLHQGPDDQTAPLGANLTVGQQASLVIDCARPFGDLEMDSQRKLTCHTEHASRISLGSDVSLAPGVKVAIRLARGARVTIPDGYKFSSDVKLNLEEGHEQIL